MNRKQIFGLACLAAFLLVVILQIVAIVSVARLKMLPVILLVLLAVVFLAYDGVIVWLMFMRGKKVPRKMAKQVAKKRRIIACVLAIIMICGCAVVTSVVGDVYKTLQAVQVTTPAEEETPAITRAVYVRTHDTAETLADAKSYRFGKLIHFDDENTRQAVEAIELQLGSKINTFEYTSVFEMADGLLAGDLDAVILSSSYVSVLEGEAQFANFASMTRILAEVEIEGTGEELDSSGLLLNAEIEIAEDGKLKPFLVYVSGSDSRVDSMQNNRSDVNILVAVNPVTRQVLLVNTPRDFCIPSTQKEGAMEKLSHAGVFGVKSSIKSLEALYDQPINYYVQVSFGGLKGLVNAVGGVTVYSDVAFTLSNDAGTIKVGENHLDGRMALAYARTRYGLEGGDRARGNHQMDIIKALIAKATSGTTIINNYAAILESVDGLFIMNIPTQLISALIKEQLADMSGWNVVTYSADGTGGYGEVYSVPGTTVYTMEPNQESVDKGAKLLDMVFAGEILSDEIINSI